VKACALEQKSEHPLARAIVSEGMYRGTSVPEVTDFSALPGNGLTAKLNEHTLHGGSGAYIRSLAQIPDELARKAEILAEQGKTPMFFEEDGKLIGIIAVADMIKPDSAEAICQLKKQGLHVVMLTGDNERTARAIEKIAGVDDVAAGVLPDGKEAVIRKLRESGRVAMVGDGINDAPALTRADTGIAIGAGTDVAIDSADIVLMNNSLMDVAAAVRLSRATLRNIHENLFWAFFYNLICIPVAAGLFAWKMNPMIGAAAMSLSSFTVCMNALRLNLFQIRDASHDRPVRGNNTNIPALVHPDADQSERSQTMKITVKIEGMMCSHCEAAVKKALEALPFVESAEVSHVAGTAELTLSGTPDEAAIKAAVEDRDYTFMGMA